MVDPALRAMISEVRMAGPAFTVVAEDDHLPVMTALAEARRGDVLVITAGGKSLPSLRALAPDVVLQAGTFSKSFFPGVRLGWAAGPAEVVAELAAAKQNTDQCAGGLGQRLVEEYGRAGGFERHLPAARKLYASLSHLTETELETAAERLAAAMRVALEQPTASAGRAR